MFTHKNLVTETIIQNRYVVLCINHCLTSIAQRGSYMFNPTERLWNQVKRDDEVHYAQAERFPRCSTPLIASM